MGLSAAIPRFLASRAGGLALSCAGQLLHVGPLRRAVVRLADNRLRADLTTEPRLRQGLGPLGAEQRLMALAALHTVDRLVARGYLAPHVTRVISRLWGRTISSYISGQGSAIVQRFRQTHGHEPPRFLVISPTQACNLRCRGCYASSDRGTQSAAHLDWAVLEEIVAQARRLWGAPLFVFSGGEPLLYRSQGKTILDLVEQNPDCLFLMFTNGTMIDRQVAQRLARLGNLTAAISVEGLRERTDARRGNGVFERALVAMALLREEGVPFGISVTVTSENQEEVLSDEFIDLFFGELGSFYGFLFQYMPIGRWQEMGGVSMPTPEQRLALWRRQWHVISERRAFLFDFWNSGPSVHGCLSAGRDRGYLYIDWNGKVMPCVFVPYAVANVHEVFARGGTLDDVYEAPLLQTMRAWQREYGFGAETLSIGDDWLRPCPIRDHYEQFRQWVAEHEPEPEDEAALDALNDPLYYERMVQYDRELKAATRDVWAKEYVRGGS